MTQTTRSILITGANKGIGRAIVEAVVEQAGDTHVFLGSRSAKRGRVAHEEILADHPDAGGRIEVVELDVVDDASVGRARQTIASRLGTDGLYGIVNNAGIGDHGRTLQKVLDVNVRGPHRICEFFLPLVDGGRGRIVNITSAAGPNFVAECTPERRALLSGSDVTWERIDALMHTCLVAADEAGDFADSAIGNASAYGLSKACLNAYTIALAHRHPNLTVNACTPGFIETDLTRPMATRNGKTPQQAGMKPPGEATTAPIFLLFGQPAGSGWYFGSDAERSPLDRYRSPGDPPYAGD